MNKHSFRLRPMISEDCVKLPSLQERVWGIKSDEAYWRWKYIEPPFETIAYVIQKEDSEIVAFTGFWIHEARIGDRDCPAYQLIDVMADPRHRGSKAFFLLFKQTTEMSRNQKLLMYGFANNVSYALFKKFYQDIILIDVDHPVFSLVIKPGDLLKAPDFIKTAIGKVTRGIVQARLSLTGTGDIQVEMADRIPDDVNQLWDEVQKEYYWILKRSSDYLKWRFQKAPQGNYQVWLAKVNGCLAGYMVTALEKRPHKIKGFIMDWLTPPKKPQIFNALLKQALKWFLQENANVVETWFLNLENSLVKSLKSKLFIHGRRNQTFLLVCENHKMCQREKILRVDGFFATRGDSDFMGT